MTEYRVEQVADLQPVLREMARRLKMSLTALVNGRGGSNGVLIGLGTGNKVPGGMALGPALRVFRAAGWKMVVKPADGQAWATVARPGALPLRVTAADGGPLEIEIRELSDLPVMFNTLALATDRTISGLCRHAGLNATALVGFATGSSEHKDVRLTSVTRLVAGAGFALFAEPEHATKRDARRAEAGRLLQGVR